MKTHTYKPNVWVDRTDREEGSMVDAEAMNNIEKGIVDLRHDVNDLIENPCNIATS